ncbi:uncharacterized protein J3R85_017458 [Psidium guajava]|nr:uncharacterized protein J3R85_017458 [Psidium guajava]
MEVEEDAEEGNTVTAGCLERPKLNRSAKVAFLNFPCPLFRYKSLCPEWSSKPERFGGEKLRSLRPPSSPSAIGPPHSSSSVSSSHLRRPGSARTPAASAPSGPSATGDQLPSPSVSSVSSSHLRRTGPAKTPVKFDYSLPPVEYYHRPELPEQFDKFAYCVSEENPHRCVVM